VFLVLREHARTYTRARVLSFLEVSRASNISDPSPSILIHRRVTMCYTRLKKPQYLVTGFPLYSLTSLYFRTSPSYAKFSRASNISDPSPSILIHRRVTMCYTRLKKPQYLVTGFPLYSLTSLYFRTSSSYAKFSRACNISDPSPSIFIHRTVTMCYTRLKKPQYLVTGFPLYSLTSLYFRTSSSYAQKPKICRRFYKIKET